jgi:hypothetical protein
MRLGGSMLIRWYRRHEGIQNQHYKDADESDNGTTTIHANLSDRNERE